MCLHSLLLQNVCGIWIVFMFLAVADIKRLHFLPKMFFYIITWNDVSKSDSGHCDKTEVEGIKEGPILCHKNLQ
jgi:hypothetical protein